MISIARSRKEENIAEYLLFLWQMEDLLRGVDFDMEKLDSEILSSISDDNERAATRTWLSKLAREMKEESVAVSGHHSETYEILNELALLQQTLLSIVKDQDFIRLFNSLQPLFSEFREKSEKIPKSDIETALTALYGVLTLRLAKKKVGEKTLEATDKFSEYIRTLTKAYHRMKAGHLPGQN